MIWASRGSVSLVQVEPVPRRVPGDWRVFFDLAVDDREPVDRLYLFEPVPVS
jgi:hypothetical protein